MSDQLLSFHCAACNVRLQVPVAMAGATGPCPSCGATITAPMQSVLPPAQTPPTPPTSAVPPLGTAPQSPAGQNLAQHAAAAGGMPPQPASHTSPIPVSQPPMSAPQPAVAVPPQPAPAPQQAQPPTQPVATTPPVAVAPPSAGYTAAAPPPQQVPVQQAPVPAPQPPVEPPVPVQAPAPPQESKATIVEPLEGRSHSSNTEKRSPFVGILAVGATLLLMASAVGAVLIVTGKIENPFSDKTPETKTVRPTINVEADSSGRLKPDEDKMVSPDGIAAPRLDGPPPVINANPPPLDEESTPPLIAPENPSDTEIPRTIREPSDEPSKPQSEKASVPVEKAPVKARETDQKEDEKESASGLEKTIEEQGILTPSRLPDDQWREPMAVLKAFFEANTFAEREPMLAPTELSKAELEASFIGQEFEKPFGIYLHRMGETKEELLKEYFFTVAFKSTTTAQSARQAIVQVSRRGDGEPKVNAAAILDLLYGRLADFCGDPKSKSGQFRCLAKLVPTLGKPDGHPLKGTVSLKLYEHEKGVEIGRAYMTRDSAAYRAYTANGNSYQLRVCLLSLIWDRKDPEEPVIRIASFDGFSWED